MCPASQNRRDGKENRRKSEQFLAAKAIAHSAGDHGAKETSYQGATVRPPHQSFRIELKVPFVKWLGTANYNPVVAKQ